MLNFRNISIRTKLILLQVITIMLILGVGFVVFVVTDIKTYKQRKAKSMIGMAQVIGTNSISILQFQDEKAGKELLRELQTVAPDIIHATIIDNKGRIFASFSRTGSDSFYIPASLAGKNSLFANAHLYVSNNIINNNEELGKVLLEVELSELDQIKQSKYEIALILLFVALGISFLISLAIEAYISKRLLFLVNTMKSVSDTGDYTNPMIDSGKDEISSLIKVFNNMMEQLKENQQRKDEFIGIASHELKTPLTSIKGYMELMSAIEDRHPNKQYVQKALENVNKLVRLIRELLDVSKIQSGQLELTMKEFNIDELLDETIAGFQMVSVTHEIVRNDNLGNQVILADRQRIEQVLINLLSNAIKYSPGEKKVIVYSQRTDADLIIRIRDFGIGVPEDEESYIFERFYRTKGRTSDISGFGLGLYICRDIIRRHHGKIWLESEEKGTAFYFSLPLKSTTNHPGN